MNQRITAKERGLLKGAIRRVFSRSELRRKVIEAARIDHFEPSRPRVTKWVRCAECKQPTPAYLAQVDHIDPIVPIETSLEEMNWDVVIDRAWCEENKLAVLDKVCHSQKTKAENKLRRTFKKGKNPNVQRSKTSKKSIKTNRQRASTRSNQSTTIRAVKKARRR